MVGPGHPVENCAGVWVLVHAGFAMSRADEVEAARTLQVLIELDELQAELAATGTSP